MPEAKPPRPRFLLAWVRDEATLLDCFFAAPSRPLGEIEDLTIDFGDSTQSYHIGDGSVAVPGLVAGLEEAHRRFATVPWAELIEPAIELARVGVDTTESQRFLHLILAAILQRDDGGRRIYGTVDRIENADFVETLERLSRPLENDLWIYRIVVGTLAFSILAVIVASTLIVITPDGDVPDVLVAIGTGAIGALAGLLAPVPSR